MRVQTGPGRQVIEDEARELNCAVSMPEVPAQRFCDGVVTIQVAKAEPLASAANKALPPSGPISEMTPS
jgi:hypothetical protein